MKIKKLLLLLLLITHFAMGQNPFAGFDFASGEYALHGWRETGTKNKLALELGDFYTNDSKALLDFKNEWRFTADDGCVCDFDYFLTITKSDSIVDEMAISLACNRVMLDLAAAHCFYFRFDSSAALKQKFNALKREDKKFTDVKSARDYWTKNKNPEKLLVPRRDEFYWETCDGSFDFAYNDSLKEHNWPKIKAALKKQLADKLKTGNFHLAYYSWESPGDPQLPDVYHVTVYCNEDFAGSFNLFEKEEEWTALKNINFTVFHKN